MSLRDRTFRRYAGALTPRRSRFLVLWRYSRREVFASKIVTGLFALSFAPLLVAAILVYLRHNVPALTLMDLKPGDVLPIDANFFYWLLRFQAGCAFVLTALVGPGLVSPDLANNGLPLYLARPFSRAEYVLGKLAVLAILISAITWVPLLLIFVLQSSLEPGWLAANLRVGWGVFVGSWLWILLVGLVSLALSAWVRWRILAGALLVATFVVGTGFSEVINEIFREMFNSSSQYAWGDLFSPGRLVLGIWQGLLFGADAASIVRLPWAVAWLMVGLVCAAALLVLNRKLRAYEVVR
jgi:ABC-2 type transport system permease protein